MNGWDCFIVGVKKDNEVVACSIILGKKMHINKYIYYETRCILVEYKN